jgi:hypothetical protein
LFVGRGGINAAIQLWSMGGEPFKHLGRLVEYPFNPNYALEIFVAKSTGQFHSQRTIFGVFLKDIFFSLSVSSAFSK